MSSVLREAIARARELLVMQGFDASVCKFVNEEEARRFLLASKLDVERASEGLAKRARFLNRYVIPTQIDFDTLKRLLPMYWARTSSSAVMFVKFSAAFNTVEFINTCGGDSSGRAFFEYLGEKIAQRCRETNSQLSVIIDVSDAPVGQTTTPEFDQLVRFGASYLQSMHPERLKNVYFINPTTTLSVMSYTLRRVSSSQTLQKMVNLESISQVPESVLSQNDIPQSMGGLQDNEWTDADSCYSNTVITQTKDSGTGELITHEGSNNMIKESSTALLEEVEQLLEVLKLSIDKANECEKVHLEENSRLRRKLRALDKETERSLDPEEIRVREQLVSALDERDAYKKAVLFARNFIDQELSDQAEFTADIEREIEQKRQENRALVESLKSAFGSDAPNLFM